MGSSEKQETLQECWDRGLSGRYISEYASGYVSGCLSVVVVVVVAAAAAVVVVVVVAVIV